MSQNVLTTLTFKDSFCLFKFLASWDWRDTSLYTPVLCAPLPLSEISDRSITEVLINSLFVPPPHPLSLSLVSLIVSQVSDSSKHCGFPHSHYTRGTRGEMCACMCMHRGGGVLHYSTVFSSAFYCWIRVNPKQRWHCCNFPLGNETSPHTTKRKKHCYKYCLNVVFL